MEFKLLTKVPYRLDHVRTGMLVFNAQRSLVESWISGFFFHAVKAARAKFLLECVNPTKIGGRL